MEELALALIVGMVGVNLAATFKLLFEVGGFKSDVAHLKPRVSKLEERKCHEMA